MAGVLAAANTVSAAGMQANTAASSLTTNAVAFKIVENTISDWATDAAMSGDWDGDGKDDVMAWSGSAWRFWHADGLSSNQLGFTEYTHNLPAAMTSSSAILQADFDGDGLDDFAFYNTGDSVWTFVRATGASGASFGFSTVSTTLGNYIAGNAGDILVGDWDGDGKDDMLGWNGSSWQLRISNSTSSAFDFSTTTHNLGTVTNGNLSLVVSGDWDGDGATDLATRTSDTANWVVWLGADVSGGTLNFTQVTDNSLGFALKSTVSRRTADFSGDGKDDVLALLGSEFCGLALAGQRRGRRRPLPASGGQRPAIQWQFPRQCAHRRLRRRRQSRLCFAGWGRNRLDIPACRFGHHPLRGRRLLRQLRQ